MTDKDGDSQTDIWSDWLLHHRHAGDPRYERVVRDAVEQYVERVLDGAQLAAGQTLADIGAGEGAVAFRAFDRIGASLRVLLTDISEPLLRHAEGLAVQRGVRDQCSFLHCAAERLTGIDDASVDAVTTRAVLAYVANKGAALREFYRILKPGGRLSIAEPSLQENAYAAWAMRQLLETRPHESLDPSLPLMHRWKAAQYPDTQEKIQRSPIANYSDGDLARLAHSSGFVDVHLELHIDVAPSINTSWDVFVHSSPHPLAPPLSVIFAEQFTAAERQLFERHMRPIVENPRAVTTDRIVYATARKPPV